MSAAEPLEFAFAFQRRYLPLLAGIGVTSKTAKVVVGGQELDVRFGFLRCRTPMANVRCVIRTGPYRAYRAIGARASLADSGATYGTTTAGGVCIEFREPVAALDPTGVFRNEALTVTVAEPTEFVTALRAAAGLPPG